MPNYTENLQLEKPLQSEQYNVDVFNANADKIDQFAGQTPARALTADKLTTGAKINGVNFKGDTDIVTGAGFYYDTVTYGAGNLAFIYNQDDALELHKSTQDGNIGHNPLTSTGYWEKVDLGGGGSSRNVGEIVTSTLPLTDAGLHLFDGSRLSGDGIYSEFVQYIADLYTDNSTANYFTDETTWQQSITDYGVCGKFVYDSTLNTVRLPKITGIVEGTTDVAALGDLVEAGLPNITGWAANDINTSQYGTGTNGAFYKGTNGSRVINSATVSNDNSLNFDASRSSSIYGNSTTVQPQAIKVLYYIVVATSTKTDIQVDIDEIATDLNGKVDKADLQEVQCVVETYSNDTSWYRIYSDGWCEQGGHFGDYTDNAPHTVSLLKPYKDTNYNAQISYSTTGSTTHSSSTGAQYYSIFNKTTSSFNAYSYTVAAVTNKDWVTRGYLAQGQS